MKTNTTARDLREMILTELDNTPPGYMQEEKTICATLSITTKGEANAREMKAAFDRLEAENLIHCEVDALGKKRWCLTPAGAAALNC